MPFSLSKLQGVKDGKRLESANYRTGQSSQEELHEYCIYLYLLPPQAVYKTPCTCHEKTVHAAKNGLKREHGMHVWSPTAIATPLQNTLYETKLFHADQACYVHSISYMS